MNTLIWAEKGVNAYMIKGFRKGYILKFDSGSESLWFQDIKSARKEFLFQIHMRAARG